MAYFLPCNLQLHHDRQLRMAVFIRCFWKASKPVGVPQDRALEAAM